MSRMLIAIAIFFVFPSKTLLAQKLDYLKWYSPLSSGAEGFPRVSVLSTPRMEVRAFKYCNYGSGLNPVRNSYELERGFYNALSKFVWESNIMRCRSLFGNLNFRSLRVALMENTRAFRPWWCGRFQ
jgi:hypothetical protein